METEVPKNLQREHRPMRGWVRERSGQSPEKKKGGTMTMTLMMTLVMTMVMMMMMKKKTKKNEKGRF